MNCSFKTAISLLSIFSLIGCSALPIDFSESGMSQAKAVAGLREALEVGAGRAIDDTSAQNGFFNDQLIKIRLPSELNTVAQAVRTAGYGDQVDELVLGMNRAAERASGEAIDVFKDVARSLTIQDVINILYGGQTAATDLFKARTTTELTRRFSPIVHNKMQEVGVYQAYDSLTQIIRQLPFTRLQSFDLERYVVDRALSGVFTKLAEQEKSIREKIPSRTTDLLQDVFGFVDTHTREEASVEINGENDTSTGSTY